MKAGAGALLVVAAALIGAAAGCSTPEDDAAAEREAKRQALARHYGELSAAERQALLQSSVRDDEDAERVVREIRAAKVERERLEEERRALAAAPRAGTPREIRRVLLDRYGPELTPFQRSYVLATDFPSLEAGERLCRKWTEENRAFASPRR